MADDAARPASKPRRISVRQRRAELEAAIAQAIDALDALDGDADLEPFLGATGGTLMAAYADQRKWSSRTRLSTLDLEEACEDESSYRDGDYEPNGDEEPDQDGDGRPNPVWTIGGQDMWEVHGADGERPLKPDEDPGEAEPRCEIGMG